MIGGGLMIVEGLKGGLLREAWLEGVMGWLWRGRRTGCCHGGRRSGSSGRIRVCGECMICYVCKITMLSSSNIRRCSYGSLKQFATVHSLVIIPMPPMYAPACVLSNQLLSIGSRECSLTLMSIDNN